MLAQAQALHGWEFGYGVAYAPVTVGPNGIVVVSQVVSERARLTVPSGVVPEDGVRLHLLTAPMGYLGDRRVLPWALQKPTGYGDLYGFHDELVLIAAEHDVTLEGPLLLALDVSTTVLRNRKIYVVTWDSRGDGDDGQGRWREASVDFLADEEFSTLLIVLYELPTALPDEDLAGWLGWPLDEQERALEAYALAVIYVDVDVERERCEDLKLEWMDLTLELDHVNGYCATPQGSYWDTFHQQSPLRSSAEDLEGSPERGDDGVTLYAADDGETVSIITANLGHSLSLALYESENLYKLSNAGVEERIRNNLNVLRPDLLLLQEMGNRFYWNIFKDEGVTQPYVHHAVSHLHTYEAKDGQLLRVQVERLIKDIGLEYEYVCTRYPKDAFGQKGDVPEYYEKGMAFECIVWNTAVFSKPLALPEALDGYTVSNGAAGIQLFQSDKNIPIVVLSVHTLSPLADLRGRGRMANLEFFKKATTMMGTVTLWAGDFNFEPDGNGPDAELLRRYVRWGHLLPQDSWHEDDFLKPLRDDKRPTAYSFAPLGIRWWGANLDHLFISMNVEGASSCKVLYDKSDRLDYWANRGSGMDHRAVVCHTSFSY